MSHPSFNSPKKRNISSHSAARVDCDDKEVVVQIDSERRRRWRWWWGEKYKI
jgi:hypothetical protein